MGWTESVKDLVAEIKSNYTDLFRPLEKELEMLVVVSMALSSIGKESPNQAELNKKLRLLKLGRGWEPGEIHQACVALSKATKQAWKELEVYFRQETEGEGRPDQLTGNFTLEQMEEALSRKTTEQEQLKQKAKRLLVVITKVTNRLNIPNPAVVPPSTTTPTEPQTEEGPSGIMKFLEQVHILNVKDHDENVKDAEPDGQTRIGWTTKPVWTEAGVEAIDLLEGVICTIVEVSPEKPEETSETSPDPSGYWEGLKVYLGKDAEGRNAEERVKASVKLVAEEAKKQDAQSDSVYAYISESFKGYARQAMLLLGMNDVTVGISNII